MFLSHIHKCRFHQAVSKKTSQVANFVEFRIMKDNFGILNTTKSKKGIIFNFVFLGLVILQNANCRANTLVELMLRTHVY